jgi:penicillin amidase
VDSTDHSLLKRDPDDPDGYLTPEGPRDYAVEKPEIHVRFAPDRTLTIRRSPAGVILSRNNPFADAGYDLARLDQSDVSPCACMLSVMLQVGRARSAMEIRDALSVYRSEPANLVFADRAGNIGYVMPGGIPERPAEVGGRLRINPDGSPPFTRLIPYEENPMVLNPPSGRLISANQAIAGREYPHYLSVAPRDVNRARRIAELLDARAIHDVDSFRAMQLDTESIAARNLLPILLQTPPANPADGELLDMLSEWDARFERDSAGPLIFSAWLGKILDAVFHDELGPMTGFVHGGDNQRALLAVLSGELAHWCDDRTTEPEDSCIDILSKTLTQVREQLAARWGADPRAWRWGQAVAHPAPHIAFRNIPVLGKAFERRMEPAGGPDALTHIAFPWRDGVDPESGYSSPYMRMIVDLADPERALFALNSGQSGHFRSPHYHDLGELLAAGEYVRIDDPGGEARTLRLQPGGEP